MSADQTAQPTGGERPRKRVRANSSKRKSEGEAAHSISREPHAFKQRRYRGPTDTHIDMFGQVMGVVGGWKDGAIIRSDAPQPISSLIMNGDAVWAASGPHVIKYLRGKEVGRLSNPVGTPLASIIAFGSNLLALTADGGRMFVWDVAESESTFLAAIQFDIGFTATLMLHPATYLNKILVASKEGDLQLWNIRTQICIHKFSASGLLSTLSQKENVVLNSPITALVQSPAIDVVGIGFTSGEISVYDVRADERLMRMYMEGGGIKSLSFRSDGHPVLASASSAGHIALWDLTSGGRLLHMIRGAHDGAVSAVEWVPGQPILISSGEDNSVKQWLFDSPTAAPRLLKFRSGHHAPPHLIRYYGDDGKQLLTASTDRSLRYTSVVRDSRSFELSQGSLSKKATVLSKPLTSLKLPPISAISYSTTRSKDWDDVLTAHNDEPYVKTWTVLGKKIGKHTFNYADAPKRKAVPGSVKCVCMSACGNFGLAGSSTGDIHMWNVQSGLKRKSYKIGPCPPAILERLESTKSKPIVRCITGLATDALNRLVIASTLDGAVNFFDFHSTALEQTVLLPCGVTSLLLQRESGLIAIVCEDMVVRIIDTETRRIVRELPCGSKGRILDVAFSTDSRWLVATSLDSVIRTFDIPTGRLIDAFRTPSIATSIALSPTNDFLASAHVDSVGVYLWANRAQYDEVSFQSLKEDDIADASLPSMQGEEDEEALEGFTALSVQDKPQDVFSTPPQLSGELVTLTLLPRSRWQTLLNLEVIQQRNKPKEPPKKPEQAPFFLPTLPGVEHRFVVEQKDAAKENAKSTRRLDKIAAESESVFQKKLQEVDTSGDHDSFFDYAKTLSPAAIDLEIRSLVTLNHLRQFLRALTLRLGSRRDFEAIQTFQGVFLRLHADVIVENSELHAELQSLLEVQRKESERVLELLASSLGTLGFVRDTL